MVGQRAAFAGVAGCAALILASCESPSAPHGDRLSIRTFAVRGAYEDMAYADSLSAMGGSGGYQWSIASGALPAGLSLSIDGVISGVPTGVASVFAVEVRSDDGQVAERTLELVMIPTVAPHESCSDHDEETVALFADAQLTREVRYALGFVQPTEITCGRLTGLGTVIGSHYQASSAPPVPRIGTLEGIHNIPNLRRLYLTFGVHPDIDLAPLGLLTELHSFGVSYVSGFDLDELSKIPTLKSLDIADIDATDVSALGVLIDLEFVRLTDNFDLADIDVLAELTALDSIAIDRTAVTDLQPLLDNPGIGEGDWIAISEIPASCAQVRELEARGVRFRRHTYTAIRYPWNECVPDIATDQRAAHALLEPHRIGYLPRSSGRGAAR